MPTTPETAVATGTAQDEAVTQSMLEEHVPISLILDMTSLVGPDSEKLFREEHAEADDWIESDDARTA